MSVVPLRISSEAASKPRDLPGTVNIPYGYRLSNRARIRPNVNLTYGEQFRLRRANKTSKYTSNESTKNGGARAPVKHELTTETVGNANYGGPEQKKNLSLVDEHSKNLSNEIINNGNAKAAQSHEIMPETHGNGKDDGPKQEKNDSVRKNRENTRRIRGKSSAKEQRPASILPTDPNPVDETAVREQREYLNFMKTFHFVERTDRKILRRNIRQFVDEGLMEYDKKIDAQREKLRSLLLSEEKSLIREVIDQAQRGGDLLAEESRKVAEKREKELEENRLATAKERRIRQFIADSPELTEKISKRKALEAKYSNLVQMLEKETRREREDEVDRYWYDLMLRKIEIEEARDLTESRKKNSLDRSIAITLKKQIEEKATRQEAEKQKIRQEEKSSENLESFSEKIAGKKPLNPTEEKLKKAKLRAELEEQMAIARKYQAARARDEETMDEAFRALLAAEIAREKAETSEKTQSSRGEIDAYRKSLAKLREEESRREVEASAIVEAFAQEYEKGREIARQRLRDNRQRALQQLLADREQQLREKREREIAESEQTIIEKESLRKEAETETEMKARAEMKKRETAMRYGQELKAQQRFMDEMRRRENEKSRIIHGDDLGPERELEKLVAEQMLNGPREIITPHAFKILLEKCDAQRRQAEQKRLCYYSRSSTQPQTSMNYP